VLKALWSVKALQGHRQGIGAMADVLLAPGRHLRVLTHAGPAGIRGHHGFELGHHLGVTGFGVDDVAHLDQPSQVGSGTEAGVHAHDNGNRIRILGIVGLQLLQVGCQFDMLGAPVFQTLAMRSDGLLDTLQLLGRLRQFLLSRGQPVPRLGQLAVGLFCSILHLVDGFQPRHFGFQIGNLVGQALQLSCVLGLLVQLGLQPSLAFGYLLFQVLQPLFDQLRPASRPDA